MAPDFTKKREQCTQYNNIKNTTEGMFLIFRRTTAEQNTTITKRHNRQRTNGSAATWSVCVRRRLKRACTSTCYFLDHTIMLADYRGQQTPPPKPHEILLHRTRYYLRSCAFRRNTVKTPREDVNDQNLYTFSNLTPINEFLNSNRCSLFLRKYRFSYPSTSNTAYRISW